MKRTALYLGVPLLLTLLAAAAVLQQEHGTVQ
jgi:hypothetical protein